MNDQDKKLVNLMGYWLFGTFVIVWAAITMYIGLFTDRDWSLAVRAGFPIWGITALLCVMWYFGYRWWLARR